MEGKSKQAIVITVPYGILNHRCGDIPNSIDSAFDVVSIALRKNLFGNSKPLLNAEPYVFQDGALINSLITTPKTKCFTNIELNAENLKRTLNSFVIRIEVEIPIDIRGCYMRTIHYYYNICKNRGGEKKWFLHGQQTLNET